MLKQVIEAAGSRIKTLGDILDYADFFTPDEQLAYDENRPFDLASACVRPMPHWNC